VNGHLHYHESALHGDHENIHAQYCDRHDRGYDPNGHGHGIGQSGDARVHDRGDDFHDDDLRNCDCCDDDLNNC